MNLTHRTILYDVVNLCAIFQGVWLWNNYNISTIFAKILFGMIMSLLHFLFNQQEAIY